MNEHIFYVPHQLPCAFVEAVYILVFLRFGKGIDGFQLLDDGVDLSLGLRQNFRVLGCFLEDQRNRATNTHR